MPGVSRRRGVSLAVNIEAEGYGLGPMLGVLLWFQGCVTGTQWMGVGCRTGFMFSRRSPLGHLRPGPPTGSDSLCQLSIALRYTLMYFLIDAK